MGIGVRRENPAERGRIIGISFAIEDGPAYYMPIGHAVGENLDPDHVWAYLGDQTKVYHGDIVGANLQYDLDYLAEKGMWFGGARFFRDVQIAEPLIDELQMSYSLESIAERHGMPGKDTGGLEEAARAYGTISWTTGGRPDPWTNLWMLPACHVAPYAIQDVRLPLDLLRRQERIIDEQGLWTVYDLESRVLPILVKMRRRGVAVDFRKLEEIEQWTKVQEAEALAKIHALTGVKIEVGEVWQPELVVRAVRAIGIEPPLTAKTKKPSVTSDFLKPLNHPVADALRRARKVNKVRTTFAESVRRYQTRGRLHCTFNQLRRQEDTSNDLEGAAYGRLSCVDPNLQQQPARDEEIGPMWRSIYIPDAGGLWASLDYSSQEPRMAVHFAVRMRCAGADDMANRFRANPDIDLHQETANLCSCKRKQAKEIFLGISYSMGGGKLCRRLGLPLLGPEEAAKKRAGLREFFGEDEAGKFETIDFAGPEGQEIMEKFHKGVPWLLELSRKAKKAGNLRAYEAIRTAGGKPAGGYVKTLSGRRCRFEPLWDRSFERARAKSDNFTKFDNRVQFCRDVQVALNRIIQGSSADQMKMGMVAMDADAFPLQLQVHDEVDFTCDGRPQAERAAQIMLDCVKLEVPSKVDVQVAANWGLCKG